MLIKICGIRRPEDVAYVNQLQPDFIGFVFAPSKRQVSEEQAALLKKSLSSNIKAVGVFVNAEQEKICRLADAHTIDMIQLHGDEDADYCRRLRQLVHLPIIKAVRVRGASSFTGLDAYPCDYLLFDTYTPGQYGGTGKRFDLRLGDDKYIGKPYFVAGGLDAGNVREVMSETNALVVDVSGGVETEEFKDYKKMADFVAAVRSEQDD